MDAYQLHAMNMVYTPIKAYMYRAGAYTLSASGSAVQFPFDTVLYDPAGLCTTGSSAHIFAPVGGTYLCTASLNASATAAGQRFLMSIGKNGTSVEMIRGSDITMNANSSFIGMTVSGIINVNAGDNITVIFESVTAFTPVFNPSQSLCFLSVHLMSVG